MAYSKWFVLFVKTEAVPLADEESTPQQWSHNVSRMIVTADANTQTRTARPDVHAI